MSKENAQHLLDELHALDLQELYQTHFETKKAKKENLSLIRDKLRYIKKSLRDETKAIESRYDGRNSYEAGQERLHLAVYAPLDDLISRIELFIKEFDIKGLEGSPPPSFGTIYDGIFDKAEWYILTPDEQAEWHLKIRLEHTEQQMIHYQSLGIQFNNQLKKATQETKETQRKLSSLQNELENEGIKFSEVRGFLIGVIFGGFIISIGIWFTKFIFETYSNNEDLLLFGIVGVMTVLFGALFFFAGLASPIVMPKRRKEQLQVKIQLVDTELKQLKSLRQEIKGKLTEAKSDYVQFKKIREEIIASKN